MSKRNLSFSPLISSEKGGAIPVLILIAVIGLVSFLAISSLASFNNQIFSNLFSIPISKASETVYWSAGMETGDMSQNDTPNGTSEWQLNGGGGEYNSGIADTVISTDLARSGSRSAKSVISTPNSTTSGTRLFRWAESRKYKQAYYSVWVYFPTQYSLTHDPSTGQFLNLFQFKSRSMAGRNDPVWAFYLQPDSKNGLKIKAGWGWGGTVLAGPKVTDNVSGKWYDQTITSVPVGRWVNFEAFVNQSTGNTSTQSENYDGQIKFWQDGQLLFDFQNIKTGYYNTNYLSWGNTWNTTIEWAVNNYSDGIMPDPATIYFDDAAITATQHWPTLTTSSPSPASIPGDIVPNGKVDIFDYNALLQDFGKTSGFNPLSDIVANEKIDIFDYNGLLQNFGKTSP